MTDGTIVPIRPWPPEVNIPELDQLARCIRKAVILGNLNIDYGTAMKQCAEIDRKCGDVEDRSRVRIPSSPPS